MATKILDSKGRVSLGKQFAGNTVMVDDTDPYNIVIKRAVVIPEQEAWLYRNPKALKLVRKGLAEAAAGKFSDSSPDLEADEKWASELED